MNRPVISGLPHPSSGPRTSAKTSMKSAPENETNPIQSMRLVLGSFDPATRVRVMKTASTPIGTLTKKIHRQPMPLVMAPPTSGPTATAPPITAP